MGILDSSKEGTQLLQSMITGNIIILYTSPIGYLICRSIRPYGNKGHPSFYTIEHFHHVTNSVKLWQHMRTTNLVPWSNHTCGKFLV